MYKVEFVSQISGNVIYKGSYKTKKAIRRANEKHDMEYGAYLSARIKDESGKEVSIWQVA